MVIRPLVLALAVLGTVGGAMAADSAAVADSATPPPQAAAAPADATPAEPAARTAVAAADTARQATAEVTKAGKALSMGEKVAGITIVVLTSFLLSFMVIVTIAGAVGS